MQHTPASPSLHLARHARVDQALALAGAALLVVQPMLLLLAHRWEWTGFLGAASFLGLPGPPPDEAARWRTALVSLLPVGGGLYALRQIWRLFGEYRHGRVFGAAAQNALMRFAWAVLLLSLLLPLARGLMTVAQSLGNPPGQRFLALSFSWFDGLHILFGAVLVAIARVMVEARRLADDNAGFV